LSTLFRGLFYSISDQPFARETPNFSSWNANFRPHAALLDFFARHNPNTPLDCLFQAAAAKNHSPAHQTTVSKKNSRAPRDLLYLRPTPAIFSLFYSINGRRWGHFWPLIYSIADQPLR
jgi:hypothetical protein